MQAMAWPIRGGVVIVDMDLLPALRQHRWYVGSDGYARRRRKVSDPPGSFSVLMHRWVLGEPDGISDHINRVTLDNRRENLRVTDRRGNAINSKVRLDNTSGHTGVTWCKRKKRWKARGAGGHSLGYHDTKEDAVAAREQG